MQFLSTLGFVVIIESLCDIIKILQIFNYCIFANRNSCHINEMVVQILSYGYQEIVCSPKTKKNVIKIVGIISEVFEINIQQLCKFKTLNVKLIIKCFVRSQFAKKKIVTIFYHILSYLHLTLFPGGQNRQRQKSAVCYYPDKPPSLHPHIHYVKHACWFCNHQRGS